MTDTTGPSAARFARSRFRVQHRLRTLPAASILAAGIAMWTPGAVLAQTPDQVVRLDSVSRGFIHYRVFLPRRDSLAIPDLQMDTSVVGRYDPLGTLYTGVPDWRYVLLREGLARLGDTLTSPGAYLEAQREARAARRGLWSAGAAPSAPSAVAAAEGAWWASIDWWSFARFAWKALLALASLGLVGVLFRKIYIERRVDLLLLGEQSAGKTALQRRLLDPSVEEDAILSLTPTDRKRVTAKKDFIPLGRFELYPRVTDVPGSTPASAWDELLGRRAHALVVVVAASRGNIRYGQGPPVDREYLIHQHGYLSGLVEGALGSKRTRKPRCVVIFIAKFDLHSDHPPDDSAARDKRRELEELFAGHVATIQRVAKSAGIPFKVVVGSAARNWNCSRVFDVLKDLLYAT